MCVCVLCVGGSGFVCEERGEVWRSCGRSHNPSVHLSDDVTTFYTHYTNYTHYTAVRTCAILKLTCGTASPFTRVSNRSCANSSSEWIWCRSRLGTVSSTSSPSDRIHVTSSSGPPFRKVRSGDKIVVLSYSIHGQRHEEAPTCIWTWVGQ